jgi:hypothetical protein
MPQSQQQVGAGTNVQEGRIGGKSGGLDLGTYNARAIVQFSSEPAGAVVLLDGTMVCSTPCSESLANGDYRIQFQKLRHDAYEERIQVTGDQSIQATLTPQFGWLTVVTTPVGLQLKVNGKSVRKSAFIKKEMEPGPLEILTDADCYVPTGEVFTIRANEHKTIKIEPPKREAGLEIKVLDAMGYPLRAKVFADGKEVGTSPGRFAVPFCTEEFSLKVEGGRGWTGKIDLVEDEVVQKEVQAL